MKENKGNKDLKINDDEKSEKSDITEEMKLEENKEINKDISNKKKSRKKKKNKKLIKIEEEETEEDKLIKETLGFNQFNTSKGKCHKDSDSSAVFLGRKAKRIYQRFMNYKPFSKILKQAYMSLNQEF